MSESQTSTIAQLLFADPSAVDFARIVAEFETVLTRLRGDRLQITWDCEDVVLMDMPGTRIVLAWTRTSGHRYAGALLISVGPETAAGLLVPQHQVHDELCSRLVERIQIRHPADATLWHQTTGPVEADLVDALFDAIPTMSDLIFDTETVTEAAPEAQTEPTPEPEAMPDPRWSQPMDTSPLPQAGSTPFSTARTRARARTSTSNRDRVGRDASNDRPDLRFTPDPDMARLRSALYPVEDAPQDSPQMRLAIHAMNATLIMVWMPLGAAVMTYSLLRGTDLRLSARILAVTGTLTAFTQSDFAAHVGAMAGVF